MGFDIYYIILVIPAMIFSFWASVRVNSAFKKYSNVYSRSNMTGRQAAEAVLRQNGVAGVTVVPISGNLTDHYDPTANQIRLSEKVYSSTSCAAIGVAAHEAGHAVQHAEGYLPIKIRSAIIPVTNIGSKLAMPLFIIGLMLSYYGEKFLYVAYAGIICFSPVSYTHLGQRHAECRRGNTDVPFCGNCRLGEEHQSYRHDHYGNRGIIYQRQLQTDIISKKPEIFCLLKIPRIEVFARCTVLDESGDRKRRKNGEYYGIRDPRAAEEKPENEESKINCGKRKCYLGQPFL